MAYVSSMVSATQARYATVYVLSNGGKAIILSACDTQRSVNVHPSALINVASADIRPVQSISIRQANMVAFPAGVKIRLYGR